MLRRQSDVGCWSNGYLGWAVDVTAKLMECITERKPEDWAAAQRTVQVHRHGNIHERSNEEVPMIPTSSSPSSCSIFMSGGQRLLT